MKLFLNLVLPIYALAAIKGDRLFLSFRVKHSAAVVVTSTLCALAVSAVPLQCQYSWNVASAETIESYIFKSLPRENPSDIDSKRVFLLIPIAEIEQELLKVSQAIDEKKPSVAKSILSQPIFEKVELKRAFNRFSDNIYYTDPDRVNIYLSGNAAPNSMQTTQYLMRNEILTKLDYLRSDIQTLDDEASAQDIADILDDCKQLLRSFQDYLSFADPAEMNTARTVVKQHSR